ncbi:hypothetical protein D3C79_777120 [compost metagenome]
MIGLHPNAIWTARWVFAQSAGLDGVSNDWLPTACTVFAGVESLGLQRVRDLAGDAHRDLSAGVGVAGAVAHGAQRGCKLASVSAVVFAAERNTGLALARLTPTGGECADYLTIPAF